MVGNIFLFILSKETCQTAGPVQGHGERSPEGGAVWKENAEEKEESLKTNNRVFSSLDSKCTVCNGMFMYMPKV